MLSVLKKLYTTTLNVLFPPICVACGASIPDQSAYVCLACFDALTIHTALTCPACGGRRHLTLPPCHKTPYILAAACAYHDPIPQLVWYFKYHKLERLRILLAALLITHISRVIPDISSYIISYIPLHPRKERERGFNQSHLLAQTVADYVHIPCIPLLTRTRYTESQTKQKNRTQRFSNVTDCFACTNPAACTGKNILLIDDVSTSGGTLLAATHALRAHHVRRVIGLVVARVD